jgi:lycopene beta-cyclase
MTTAAPDVATFDFAIIGAGVSGLTLAWLLSDSALAESSILLIDGTGDDHQQRTLSFWSRGSVALDPLVRHHWRTLRLQLGDEINDVPLDTYTYRTLFFADLEREAKARLARRPQHRIVQGRLDLLVDEGAGVNLFVGGDQFRARWVFDSRFHLHELKVDTRRYHLLRQHFHGWVVRAPQDVFDSGVATLFDFRVEAPAGTAFFYLLPFSPRDALIELVTLDAVDPEPLLRGYLARAFGGVPMELGDHEAGVSPMTEQPFAWQASARVRRIGIPAGRLKASTGYALTRILDDCTAIVECLSRHGHPLVPPSASRFYRLLDSILLEVWESEPAALPGVFRALFRRNSMDRVLRFLDESATWFEALWLGLSLPFRPFLRAMVRRLQTRCFRAPSRRSSRSG